MTTSPSRISRTKRPRGRVSENSRSAFRTHTQIAVLLVPVVAIVWVVGSTSHNNVPANTPTILVIGILLALAAAVPTGLLLGASVGLFHVLTLRIHPVLGLLGVLLWAAVQFIGLFEFWFAMFPINRFVPLEVMSTLVYATLVFLAYPTRCSESIRRGLGRRRWHDYPQGIGGGDSLVFISDSWAVLALVIAMLIPFAAVVLVILGVWVFVRPRDLKKSGRR